MSETVAPRPGKPTRRRRMAVTGFTMFLVFLMGFLVFVMQNVRTVEVKGNSMEPTFFSGQRLYMSRAYWLVGDIKRNDIVVAREEDGDIIIKRVYAIGGDTVDFYNIPEDWDIANGEYRVPSDQYYILGDNRPVSEDSRLFGSITRDDILGKIVIVGFGPPTSASAQAR